MPEWGHGPLLSGVAGTPQLPGGDVVHWRGLRSGHVRGTQVTSSQHWSELP